jgi:hypothetical protein
MKLVGLDLHYLRRALRRLPDSAQHVPNLDSIERMREAGLLALTEKLGRNARALIEAAREQDRELQQWADKFPAFDGVLELDATIELLGQRVTRKIRVQYEHNPQREYFDRVLEAPFVGWASQRLRTEFRTVPDKDGAGGGPSWEGLGICDIGEVWEIIDEEIERRCKVEDAKRRQAAARKRPVP